MGKLMRYTDFIIPAAMPISFLIFEFPPFSSI